MPWRPLSVWCFKPFGQRALFFVCGLLLPWQLQSIRGRRGAPPLCLASMAFVVWLSQWFLVWIILGGDGLPCAAGKAPTIALLVYCVRGRHLDAFSPCMCNAYGQLLSTYYYMDVAFACRWARLRMSVIWCSVLLAQGGRVLTMCLSNVAQGLPIYSSCTVNVFIWYIDLSYGDIIRDLIDIITYIVSIHICMCSII